MAERSGKMFANRFTAVNSCVPCVARREVYLMGMVD